MEDGMTKSLPENEALRRKGPVLDQRQQQIDPAGQHRVDQDEVSAKRSQKQPGQSLTDPQEEPDDAK
ncbi:hypothetical protein D1012_09730 [Pseudotabrizicola alkalilacus]|uniref:Uncharacterized protein n=2 Tax=Pseudotabrizicola alkalilacus TaxID=2305252 RepID=A0A411Z3G6_9RHOB|nr:hypothetical protein D1012_09730 [Pseudotabrizicola alkalilacus]